MIATFFFYPKVCATPANKNKCSWLKSHSDADNAPWSTIGTTCNKHYFQCRKCFASLKVIRNYNNSHIRYELEQNIASLYHIYFFVVANILVRINRHSSLHAQLYHQVLTASSLLKKYHQMVSLPHLYVTSVYNPELSNMFIFLLHILCGAQ